MATPAWAAKAQKEAAKRAAKSKGGGNFFKFADGTNVLRFLRRWDGDNDKPLYVTAAYHYKVGPDAETMLCPEQTKNPETDEPFGKCYLCKLKAQFVVKAKDEDDEKEKKRLYAEADKLRAKARHFANSLDLKKPDAVQTVAFGNGIEGDIINLLCNEEDGEYGRWWPLKDGKPYKYDFKIKKAGKDLDTTYTVMPTKAYVNAKVEADLDSLPNLEETIFADVPDFEATAAKYLGEDEEEPEEPEEAEETEDEEEEQPKKKAKKKEEPEEEDEEPEAEEEEEVEEEPEEEEPPKKAKKKAAEPEEDEEEPEEEPEEEAEEEEPAEEEEEEAPKKGKAKPECFGDPDLRDEDASLCKKCSFFKECGKVCAAASEEEPEEEEPEEEAEEEPPKKAKKKAKPEPEEDEEEPEEEPEEEEEEEEEAPKKKANTKAKAIEAKLKAALAKKGKK